MTRKPHWLLDFAAKTHSQTGEDGIIAKILSMLPETDEWCVEFGAWDGIHLSNVRKLILERQYRAVLIEGDQSKFQTLCNNYASNSKVHALNAFVGFDTHSGLDSILPRYGIPTTFDLLSIDIDGNDYHVWKAVKAFRPKVVCVEFNPTIPTEVHFVQAPDPNTNHGNSLLAMNQLARAKGYQLVCVLPWNAIFVDEKYFPLFDIADNRPEVMRKDVSNITWLFTGQDGSVHLAGSKRMPWHGIAFDERKMQVLPKGLQAYPDNYSDFQSALFRLLKGLGLLHPGLLTTAPNCKRSTQAPSAADAGFIKDFIAFADRTLPARHELEQEERSTLETLRDELDNQLTCENSSSSDYDLESLRTTVERILTDSLPR